MPQKKSTLRTELFQLLLLVVLMTVFRSSFADHYHVPTGSMEYTLMPGDRVVVDKTAYGLRLPLTTIDLFGAAAPARGDVVVFDSPVDGTRLIKRIVATGGDTVGLEAGRLSVNGEPIGAGDNESYADREVVLNLQDGGGPDIGQRQIPPGMVLALGDHRGNSLDGRYFGLISESEIVGRAVAIYYRRGDGLGWRPL